MNLKSLEDIEAAEMLLSPPGDTLAETLEDKHLSQKELAERMGRPLKTINEIIKGKAQITPETALQLERVLDIPASFWIERERNYQLELAEIAEARQMLEAKAWVANFPLKEMQAMGWVKPAESLLEKVNSVLHYFSVSSPDAYESYYRENTYEAAFRLSHGQKNPYAVAAWLRQGEVQAAELETPAFQARKFKAALQDIKELMARQQDSFFHELQQICLHAGVKVVHTPNLPKSPACGSTRWIDNAPVIQLSNRFKRNDIFWFTFFHEAGHILLHGKKDVFVEGLEYTEEGQIKEEEANAFAIDWTLTKKQEEHILSHQEVSVQDIEAFAKEFVTLPALIIGRLAKQGIIHESIGWKYKLYRKIMLEQE